jgi:hypothetical protein
LADRGEHIWVLELVESLVGLAAECRQYAPPHDVWELELTHIKQRLPCSHLVVEKLVPLWRGEVAPADGPHKEVKALERNGAAQTPGRIETSVVRRHDPAHTAVRLLRDREQWLIPHRVLEADAIAPTEAFP